jgi:membrane-bound lytic murein transglycosylase F
MLVAALLTGACAPAPAPAPSPEGNALIVVVRPGPTTWFAGAGGVPTGLDHDLIQRFADEQKLPLMIVVADSAGAVMARVQRGQAHIGTGGLSAPEVDARSRAGTVLWTEGYHRVEPVLIYNTGGFKPASWRDLDGATVTYAKHTGLDAQLAEVRAVHPEVRWKAVDPPSPDALIAQVSDGIIDYGIVASSDAAAMRNVYLDVDVAFPAGRSRDLAWAVAPSQPALREAIDRFFERLRRDGSLARYADRYFRSEDIQRVDAGVFQERIGSTLPQYRPYFHEAQMQSGIEWRLLAAVAYQESQWDPLATSETGVRGLMQLTEDTALRLGVTDRLDPRASALGGARYLRTLKDKLP